MNAAVTSGAEPSVDVQFQRALTALADMARDRATSVLPVPGGIAVLHSDFPAAHNHNRLVIQSDCTPAELVAAADDVLGGAGLSHRAIDVYDPVLGRQLAAGMAPYGYTAGEELLMAVTGPAKREAPSHQVVALDVDERAAVASAEWRREQPEWEEEVIDQLGRRISTVLLAATAHFFAVRGSNGDVVARVDLYQRDGLAQVEEVMTHPSHRGRGLASSLVLHAVRRAQADGATLTFLVAEADDWPKELYRRLGFSDLGRTVTLETASASAIPPEDDG